MKKIGLDVGDKTIGVAISDEFCNMAFSRDNYRRDNLKKDVDFIFRIILDESIDTVVVGLPLNMNGTRGPQADKVATYVKELEKKLKYSSEKPSWSVTIEMWDERLTTVSAHRHLISADVSRQKRKEVVDKVAATFILQGYLDKINSRRNDNNE